MNAFINKSSLEKMACNSRCSVMSLLRACEIGNVKGAYLQKYFFVHFFITAVKRDDIRTLVGGKAVIIRRGNPSVAADKIQTLLKHIFQSRKSNLI